MRTFLYLFLVLPITVLADDVRLSVGMRYNKVVALVKKHSGTDITSGIELNSPKGVKRPKGIYWSFRDYDAIITLSQEDGKVSQITFWRKSDFQMNKSNRAETEQSIGAISIDTETKKVAIETKKPK